MDEAKRQKISSRVLQTLEHSQYAATALVPLTGGTANFTYHANLKTPLQDGTKDVLVKHSEEFIANTPSFKLAISRCRVEAECLKTLTNLPGKGQAEASNGSNFVVRAPKFYHFDEQNNTQIQEIMLNGKNLKAYALATYSPNTPDSARSECHHLGRALGKWLHDFHRWSAMHSELRETLAGNEEMQDLKHMINFTFLQDRVAEFPSVLTEAKDIFAEVEDMAIKELQDESQLQPIHGDFWTGNVLLPSGSIREGSEVPMLVIDWEMSRIGLPNLDLGQMMGELYELKLYKDITAGLWMLQGFLEGYGPVGEDFAYRTAIQMGTHLVAHGGVEGWGTPEQVEMVARTGRDIIVHAWQRDRAWFHSGELACLFQLVDPVEQET
ncbi:kinase-like domain-containing protein [Xylariaceae sp. FL1272]|nr:kinase-like domain-containing protein [Xylariaceae sp. FL1272]